MLKSFTHTLSPHRSLPDIRLYSLLASIVIVPKISTTPLGTARDADLSIHQALSSISKGSGFPLNLSPLNNDHWIPDLGRELRSEIKKSALMSATTVPLLFLPPRNGEVRTEDPRRCFVCPAFEFFFDYLQTFFYSFHYIGNPRLKSST